MTFSPSAVCPHLLFCFLIPSPKSLCSEIDYLTSGSHRSWTISGLKLNSPLWLLVDWEPSLAGRDVGYS